MAVLHCGWAPGSQLSVAREPTAFWLYTLGSETPGGQQLSAQGQTYCHLDTFHLHHTPNRPTEEVPGPRLKAGTGHSPEPGPVDAGACHQWHFKDCKGRQAGDFLYILCPTQKQKESSWQGGQFQDVASSSPGGHGVKAWISSHITGRARSSASPDNPTCPQPQRSHHSEGHREHRIVTKAGTEPFYWKLVKSKAL